MINDYWLSTAGHLRVFEATSSDTFGRILARRQVCLLDHQQRRMWGFCCLIELTFSHNWACQLEAPLTATDAQRSYLFESNVNFFLGENVIAP